MYNKIIRSRLLYTVVHNCAQVGPYTTFCQWSSDVSTIWSRYATHIKTQSTTKIKITKSFQTHWKIFT